jgi:NAD(P)-dependent dehydrogenase (short-subunit alcohol dehydrogenase family)
VSGGIVVTGAAGGLGAATVERLAMRGVDVLAVDLDSQGLEALAGRSAAWEGDVVTHTADATDTDAVAGFVALAGERFGGLAGIFNNVGYEGVTETIEHYPDDVFERVFRTNVRSAWLGMKHAIPLLLAHGGGAILNTTSTGGLLRWPRLSAYVGSKHAVIGLTKAVALEQARSGIRVNALCPGPMDTRMIWSIGERLGHGERAQTRELFEAGIPAGRLGRPEEVAAVAAWVLLDSPAFLTGAVIPVDGAQTAGPAS